MREVILRSVTLDGGVNDEHGMNAKIVSKFISLVENMKFHGRDDREQVHFMDNLALAVTGGDIPLVQLGALKGLSRRVLLRGRIVRSKFDDESTKAEEEAKEAVLDSADIETQDIDLVDKQAETSDASDVESVSSTDSVSSPTIQQKVEKTHRCDTG